MSVNMCTFVIRKMISREEQQEMGKQKIA
ncbi:hypothetical protein EVA_14416, partial [gut metagenome]